MLLIDDRENPKVIDKILMRMGDASLDKKGQGKVLRMKSSDYRMGTWGIEAKEINDLYRSILGLGRTRTVVDQLRDLEREFENPFLVVYGTKLKPYIPGGRPTARLMAIETARMKKVIQQFKMNFYQRFPKIQYMELATMDEFVEWLVMNHHQINIKGKIGVSKLPVEIQKEISKSKLDPRIRILSSIDGITTKHAEDLLEKFGSIPKLLSARTTQKSIMEIEGLGREKAKRILNLRESIGSESA
tara:strand:+ start:964 stop:1698 length:735 start_codon:yes stop_codon:yes gene_type:complete